MVKKMRSGSKGFTLIELLVVVLIIGILAAIAVPQYFKVVEKGKFAECTQWISGLKGAQERYLAKQGTYCTSGTAVTSCNFDVSLGTMKYFSPGTVTATATPNWTITMTRKAPTPAVYAGYTVTYDKGAATPLTCAGACGSDLQP